MRPCSSSGMDRRILLYTRFPAGVVRPFDGTTRFRRLFSVGSCFWFSNGSPETLRTLCDKPASLFLGASWGQLSLTPHLFKLCRHELRKSMPQRSGGSTPLSWHRLKVGGYSCRTTLSREVSTCSPPLYLMKPSFLNFIIFMNKLTRERVAPIISASISCVILGSIFCGWASWP